MLDVVYSTDLYSLQHPIEHLMHSDLHRCASGHQQRNTCEATTSRLNRSLCVSRLRICSCDANCKGMPATEM